MRRYLLAVLLCVCITPFAHAADELLVRLKVADSLLGPKGELTDAQTMQLTQTTRDVVLAQGLPLVGVQIRSNGMVRVILESDSATLERIAAKLLNDARVESASPNRKLSHKAWSDTTPTNDTYQKLQLGLKNPTAGTLSGIDLMQAWQKAVDKNAYDTNNMINGTTVPGNTGVIVAVVDSGVLYGHPDLTDRLLPGYNFISDSQLSNSGGGRSDNAGDPGGGAAYATVCSNGAVASSWHGTAVAGIIAAIPHNGKGITGINGDVKILPVRALGLCGEGNDADILDAVYWAAGLSVTGVPNNPYPARIINLSLGGKGACTSAWKSAISAIKNTKDALIIAAAGNDGEVADSYTPSGCPGVVTVASVDPYGMLASYSNRGGKVALSAPGGDYTGTDSTSARCGSALPQTITGLIVTTSNDGTTKAGTNTYCEFNGTSAAAPMVSGVAALMLSINPWLNADDLAFRLINSTERFITAETDNNGWIEAGIAAGKQVCTTSLCGKGLLSASNAVKEALIPTVKVIYSKTNEDDPIYNFDFSRSHNPLNNNGALQLQLSASAPKLSQDDLKAININTIITTTCQNKLDNQTGTTCSFNNSDLSPVLTKLRSLDGLPTTPTAFFIFSAASKVGGLETKQDFSFYIQCVENCKKDDAGSFKLIYPGIYLQVEIDNRFKPSRWDELDLKGSTPDGSNDYYLKNPPATFSNACTISNKCTIDKVKYNSSSANPQYIAPAANGSASGSSGSSSVPASGGGGALSGGDLLWLMLALLGFAALRVQQWRSAQAIRRIGQTV